MANVFLERYRSTRPIEPQEFFIYQIERKHTDLAVNMISLARFIAGYINNSRMTAAISACTACDWTKLIREEEKK